MVTVSNDFDPRFAQNQIQKLLADFGLPGPEPGSSGICTHTPSFGFVGFLRANSGAIFVDTIALEKGSAEDAVGVPFMNFSPDGTPSTRDADYIRAVSKMVREARAELAAKRESNSG